MTEQTNTEQSISEQAVAANAMIPAPVNSPTASRADLMASLASKGFQVVKQVTRTVLQQRDGVPFAVRFASEPYEGQQLEAGRGGKPKMNPARLCEVINLETGALQLLIMNTVLEGELDRNYPDGAFVGRTFVINGYKPVDADGTQKRYRVYEIVEISAACDMIVSTPVSDGSSPVNRKGEKPKG